MRVPSVHRPARRATAAKRRASQPHIAANRSACAWQGSPLCGFGLRSTQCAACLNTATCAMAGSTTAPAFVLRDPILLPAIITADRAASFGPLNNVLGSACIARCVGQTCETQDCLLWGSHLGQHSKKTQHGSRTSCGPCFHGVPHVPASRHAIGAPPHPPAPPPAASFLRSAHMLLLRKAGPAR